MADLDLLRAYWDTDAATYDRSAGHAPTAAVEVAAWTAAVARALPPPPARVLDVGAGTGFLTLLAARLGHEVVALDLSAGMLERLQDKAAAEGLVVACRERPATDVGEGGFDAVISRHLLWTLPDPRAALTAWRRAAPGGRLGLLESSWGRADPPGQRLRAQARHWLRRARGVAPDHHRPYDEGLRAALPLASGTPLAVLLALVAEAGWTAARVERLRDVEWAAVAGLPLPERLLGASPRYLVAATAPR